MKFTKETFSFSYNWYLSNNSYHKVNDNSRYILLDMEDQNLSPSIYEHLNFQKTCIRFGPPIIQGNDRANVCFTWRSLPQTGTSGTPIEPCTPPSTYSYFWGSELSFLITTGIECLIVGIHFIIDFTGIYSNLIRLDTVGYNFSICGYLQTAVICGYQITEKVVIEFKNSIKNVNLISTWLPTFQFLIYAKGHGFHNRISKIDEQAKVNFKRNAIGFHCEFRCFSGNACGWIIFSLQSSAKHHHYQLI